MPSKSTVAVYLSKLEDFQEPKVDLEQYATGSELAAELLHNAEMIDGLAEKKVLDLGAGTGMLGIGAMQYGAKAIFLEIDKDAIEVLKRNLTKSEGEYEIIWGGAQPQPVDIVVMNPPFGHQQRGADKPFLEAAMQSAPVIYSIHNSGSEAFLEGVTKEHGYRITHAWKARMRLPKTMAHHRKGVEQTEVLMIRAQRQAL